MDIKKKSTEKHKEEKYRKEKEEEVRKKGGIGNDRKERTVTLGRRRQGTDKKQT